LNEFGSSFTSYKNLVKVETLTEVEVRVREITPVEIDTLVLNSHIP